MTALSALVDLAAEGITDAEAPADADEAHDLMHTVDRLAEAVEKFQRHLAYHPKAQIDRHGRCHQCGRLFALPPRPIAWNDGPRGCGYVVGSVVAHARWVTNYAMSVPFAGKALWVARRRGSA